MLKKVLQHVTNQVAAKRQYERNENLYQKLLRHEAKIGGTVFGPVPKNGRREFFCLDEHTWIWHEEWVDNNRQRQVRTTRYDVRPAGVLKSQNGGHFQPVNFSELRRLFEATQAYQKRVNEEIYQSA